MTFLTFLNSLWEWVSGLTQDDLGLGMSNDVLFNANPIFPKVASGFIMVTKTTNKVFKILIKANFNFLPSHLEVYLRATSFRILVLTTSLQILVFSFT